MYITRYAYITSDNRFHTNLGLADGVLQIIITIFLLHSTKTTDNNVIHHTSAKSDFLLFNQKENLCRKIFVCFNNYIKILENQEIISLNPTPPHPLPQERKKI